MEFKELPIIRFFSGSAKNENLLPINNTGNLTPKLKGTRQYKFDLGIEELDVAILRAMAENYPDRVLLMNAYKSHGDLHVKSQIKTAVFEAISEDWYIFDQDYQRREDLEKLLSKLWFIDLNRIYIETEFFAHSLVYFWMLENGEINKTKLFPRSHVEPKNGDIIPDLNDLQKRVNYRDNPLFDSVFIEMGDHEDLGILEDVVRNAIIKTYGLKDWARSSEKWGDPHVVLKSASQDEDENDKKEEWLRNFAHNGYVMADIDDEIELLERKGTGSHSIFKELIELMNSENSKGINGQVATADEKSFVGSAEVHERILNKYTKARLFQLMYFHSETTFPFLAQLNGGNNAYRELDGMRFVPKILLKKEGDDESEDPDPKNPNPNDPKNHGNPFT